MREYDPYRSRVPERGAPQRRVVRKRRNRRRRPGIRLFWLLGILIGEIIAVGLWEPRFNVKRIEVSGTSVLTPAEVVRCSGLTTGGNLFRARLGPARKHLATLVPVSRVSVHRRLPNRLLIRVVERQPMACIAAQTGHFTVDAEGRLFRADAGPAKDLPLVLGLESRPMRLGQHMPPVLAGAVRDCLASVPVGRRLTRISIDQNANLCFNSKDMGYEVRLGPPEQLREKFVLLAALENRLPDVRRDCEYIDVSCLEAPAWKPRTVNLAHSGESAPPAQARPSEGLPNGRGGLAQD